MHAVPPFRGPEQDESPPRPGNRDQGPETCSGLDPRHRRPVTFGDTHDPRRAVRRIFNGGPAAPPGGGARAGTARCDPWRRSRPAHLSSGCRDPPDDRAARLAAAAERARSVFGDRVVWHVNATAHGGGVAEMLQTLLAYGKGAGVENRWLVLDGDRSSSRSPSDCTTCCTASLATADPRSAEHAHYEAVLRANLDGPGPPRLTGDIVLLHDPQTAGLIAGLRAVGPVVWRCHVGRDRPTTSPMAAGSSCGRTSGPHMRWCSLGGTMYRGGSRTTAWSSSLPPSTRSRSRTCRCHPRSSPPSSPGSGWWPTVVGRDRSTSSRRDGSPGRCGPIADSGGLLLGGDPPPLGVPLVVQVSRWDRLKDMAGVMEGFVRAVCRGDLDGAHLVLAGPEVSGVSRRPRGRRGARGVPGASGSAFPTGYAAACTWPPSPWTTSTRTPSSSTRCSGTPPWWCRRAWSRDSG